MKTTLTRGTGCFFGGGDPLFGSLTVGAQTLAFNYPVGVEWRPECENAVWGTPPAVESSIAATGFSHWFDGFNGTPIHNTFVVTLTPPAKVFGFEGVGEISSGTATIVAVYKDKDGNVLGTVSRANGPTVGSNLGAQLVAASSDTPIASVEITTLGAGNVAGITLALGQIRVGQSLIESVEISQAIQQYQILDDLKKSLKDTGDPPVPIVTGKPAVLRAYLENLPAAMKLQVRLSGVSNQTKTVTMPPNCRPASQRAEQDCPSLDFYFTPPHGSWAAHLDIVDAQGAAIEHHDLSFRSIDTQSLLLRAVSVCDDREDESRWQCQKASSLTGNQLSLLRKIVPASQVSRNVTDKVVRRDTSPYTHGRDGYSGWWDDVAGDMNALFSPADLAADTAANRRTLYYGLVRPSVGDGTIGGIALPSHSAAGLSSVTRLGNEVNLEVLAHEGGHNFGIKHTNTNLPVAAKNAEFGCYNKATDASTDWPFADNRIQSHAMLEVGFDVAAKKPLDPNSTFENQSFCTPRWISPLSYKKMINVLTAGVYAPSTPSLRGPVDSMEISAFGQSSDKIAGPKSLALSSGSFWRVKGKIHGALASFSPLFLIPTQGSTDAGAGPYSLEVQDASGHVLFVRQFTPQSAETETTGPDFVGDPAFSELIPVQANAKSIVLKDSSHLALGQITLSGSSPIVAVITPLPFFKAVVEQTVSWVAVDAGGGQLTSRVDYSSDGGATWDNLGEVTDNSMVVDFDDLPGSSQALIRVLVSDGVNTGKATSFPFPVPKKGPQPAEISAPTANSFWAASDPVNLTGSVFDPDDGDLDGAALQWTSDRQGPLGTGSNLWVMLQPGKHRITLTGKDSDGNRVSATTSITVADQPPVVTVTASGATITVDAEPGVNGAPISTAAYSVDGGNTWTDLHINSLPFRFRASGPTDLIAQATDASGQFGLAEATALKVPVAVTISPRTATVPLSRTQQFTASVAGVSDNSVIWSISPNVGFINTTGLYTATFANPVPQTVTITATSLADTTVTGTATVTVTAGPAIFLTGVSGDGQSTPVNSAFGARLVVNPRDFAGNPVPNAPVTFTAPALSGASGVFQTTGTNVATVNSDSTGTATSPPLKANGIAGFFLVASTTGSSSPNYFSMTNLAGPPAAMAAVSGSTPQSASVNQAFANPLAVVVKDSSGNPVSGVSVVFTAPSLASAAGGTFAGATSYTATTGPDGIATSAAFTGNSVAGQYSVKAVLNGLTVSFVLQNTP